MNLSHGSHVKVRTGAPFAGKVGTVLGSPVYYGTSQTVKVRLDDSATVLPYALSELRFL
jgi:hypothetical protein